MSIEMSSARKRSNDENTFSLSNIM